MPKEVKEPMDVNAEKDKVLEATLKDIRNYYNDKGIIMKMGEHTTVDVGVIPTGSLLLDAALGVGGYPKGRIIEIYGPESSGKTTLALEAIAQVQKLGGRAAYIDAEHAIDPDYAKTLGVNIQDLILSQPDNRIDASSLSRLIKFHHSVHHTMIRNRRTVHPQLFDPGYIFFYFVGTI